MIALTRVETEEDVEAFLALRRAIDPEHMPSRTQYVEHINAPGRVDLLASLDGEPVGCGFVEPHSENVQGTVAWISVRVLRERRRRGVGTTIFRELSALARADCRAELLFSARHDDCDSFDYLGKRGFVEALRMRESVLDLDRVDTHFVPPGGVELVPLAPDLELEVFEAAIEISRDIPTAQEAFDVGTIDQWRRNEVPAATLRGCSFAALADGNVIGYAILVEGEDGVGLHSMTGVRPAWRRRGVALALKQAQIDAARSAGLMTLRTANAVQNPMLRVNERLGFRRDVDWIHLRGPLLDG